MMAHLETVHSTFAPVLLTPEQVERLSDALDQSQKQLAQLPAAFPATPNTFDLHLYLAAAIASDQFTMHLALRLVASFKQRAGQPN